MFNDIPIENFLEPIDKFQHFHPDDLVESIIGFIQKDQPILVFENYNYLGIVSIYQTLHHPHPSPTAKIGSNLFTPPRINSQDSLPFVANQLLATRQSYLPVATSPEASPVHLVSRQNIIASLTQTPKFLEYLSQNLPYQTPATLPLNANLGDALALLKNTNLSHAVLLDDKNKASSIITLSDIFLPLFAPSPRQRFPGRGARPRSISYDTEDVYRLGYPAQDYAQQNLILTSDSSPTQLITTLINNKSNYVLLTNPSGQPLSIITSDSLLETIKESEITTTIPIEIPSPTTYLRKSTLNRVSNLLESFSQKTHVHTPIQKIKLHIKPSRFISNRPSIYSLTLQITTEKKGEILATNETRQLYQGIRSLINAVSRQIRDL